MKGNKACVIGCLVAAVLGVVAGGACLWTAVVLTAPVTEASELFLSRISQAKVGEAYTESASTLRASSTEQEFAAAVSELGLADYQSASWSSRNLQNQTGSVRGTVTTRSGSVIPLAISLVHEGGRLNCVCSRRLC